MKTNPLRFNKKSSVLLVATISAVIGAQASTVSADDMFMLDEIVVTATKRPESLQDVSVSVSAVSSDFMQDAGIADMNDVSTHVPSLTVTTNVSPWNTSFRMRRVGHEGNIPTFEPDVGLFIDGAFRSKSGLGLGDLADIERIEVLKGPQSTLYGKNVTAGVIGVTTAAPSQEFTAMAEATLANDDYSNVKGYVNGGLSDTLAGRLSFSTTRRDEVMDNIGSGDDSGNLDNMSLRGQLLIEPNDDLSIRLIASAVKRDMTVQAGDPEWDPQMLAAFTAVQSNALAGLFALPAGAPSNTTPMQDNITGNRKLDSINDPHTFSQDSFDFSATVTYEMDGLTLTSITSYDEYDVETFMSDVTHSPLAVVSFHDTTDGYSYSQEFRLSSPGGETIDWLAGAFYYHNNFTRGDGTDTEFTLLQDIDNLGMTFAAAAALAAGLTPAMILGAGGALPVLGMPGDTGNFYNEQDTDTFGIFVSATWNISDTWSVSGSLRYGYEEKDAEMALSQNVVAGSVLLNATTPNGFTYEDKDDWDAVTGNLSTEYHLNDDVMLYASYSRGFKAGGYNLGFGTTPITDRPFDEEKVDAFELGWKTQLLSNRLQFNGAIFHTEYTDFQSAAFTGLSFLVNNAEEVTVDGIEFDGVYLISKQLTFNYAVSYVKAQYDKFTDFTPAEGEDLAFAPRWKASAGLQYEQPLAGGDLYTRVDVAWVDDSIPDTKLEARNEQSDYAHANVKLGWRNDSWDLSLWGKNVTNQDWVNQASATGGIGGATGSRQLFLNDPASAGVTVRYIY